MNKLLISLLQLAVIFSAHNSLKAIGYDAQSIKQVYIQKAAQKLVDKLNRLEIMFDIVNEVNDVPTEAYENGFQWLGNAGPGTAVALYYSVNRNQKVLIQEVPILMQDRIIKLPLHLYINDRFYDSTVVIEFRHKKHGQLRGVDNVFISAKLVPVKAGG